MIHELRKPGASESHGAPRRASMRTPLGRVRNLGASHSGTKEFWRQRISAVGMILLAIPMILIVMTLLGRNQAGAAQVVGSPVVAVFVLLFILASVFHMRIGMQIIIEDYIHGEKLKLVSIMANNFFTIAVALFAIFAIVKLASGV